MPFDSAPQRPNPMVDVFDRMLGILGPNGEHWTKGSLMRDYGGSGAHRDFRYCAIGALRGAMRPGEEYQDAEYQDAKRLLLRGIRMINPSTRSIERWNDVPGRTFDRLREAIENAKTIALLRETTHAV